MCAVYKRKALGPAEEMKALERIKEIEKYSYPSDPEGMYQDVLFLIRAFRVMREIAIEHNTVMSRIDGSDVIIDKKFEERMAKEEGNLTNDKPRNP